MYIYKIFRICQILMIISSTNLIIVFRLLYDSSHMYRKISQLMLHALTYKNNTNINMRSKQVKSILLIEV